MHVLKKETAPRYVRPEGITSYLLASPRTSSAEHLTTTLSGHLEKTWSLQSEAEIKG